MSDSLPETSPVVPATPRSMLPVMPDRAAFQGVEHDNPRHHPHRPTPDPLTGELLIDPDIVLFGGGMIAAGTPFLDQIRTEIRRIAFPVPAAQTRIEYAELGGDAGFIGAAGCARMVYGLPSSMTFPA